MSSQRHTTHRPLIRRAADDGERTAPDWETLTERLIREAQEAGSFDDLPYQGRSLRLDADARAGEMALTYRVMRNAGFAPAWIEADKEIRQLREELQALVERASRGGGSRDRLVRELERIADAYDAAVLRLAVAAPTPAQQRLRLDRGSMLDQLDAALTRSDER